MTTAPRDEPEHVIPRAAPARVPRAPPSRAPEVPARGGAWAEAPPIVRVAAGAALFGRRLSWADDLFARLAGNEVLPALQLTASGALFPLRALSQEAFAHVGVGFELSGAAFLDSYSEEHQATLATRAHAWIVDLRYELPVDGHVVGATVGFGEEVFGVDLPPPSPGAIERPAIRSVAYRFVRPSLTASVRLHEVVRLDGRVGWRALVSTGGLDASQGLPPSDGAGWDAELALGVRIAWFFEARLRAGYHAYFFAFHPTPGDHYVVGGALDEWIHLGLDAVVFIPGSAP